MKEKRKRIISVAALILIIVLIVTATYAYFAAQTSEGSSTDINITAGTVDNLTFETGDAININATQSNFATGMTSLSDDTYVKATLVANNDTNSASANYYVYLNISTNEFEYTTSDSTAELILSITMDGTEVTSLDGYNYVSVTDGNSNVISGFDITTASGLITIADNYLIESTGIEVDDWEVTVTFVNLDSNQSGNAGVSFSASLIIQSDEYITLADYIISTVDTDDTLYYLTDDISQDTTGATYGICEYNNEDLYSYNHDDEGKNVYTEENCSTIYYVVDFAYNDDSEEWEYFYDDAYYIDASFADYWDLANPVELVWDSNDNVCYVGDYNLTEHYQDDLGVMFPEDYCTGYAYQDQYGYGDLFIGNFENIGSGEYNTYTYSAQDLSYRYTGTSDEVNNFVCFGSDTCDDTEDLYRIIGLFLNETGQYEVKLIKYDYANSDLLGEDGDYQSNTYNASNYSNYIGSKSTINTYGWNTANYLTAYNNNAGYYNDWSYSQLNTVNLNKNYYNSLDSKWQSMITNHTWIVGGINTKLVANNLYNNELVNYTTTQVTPTYKAKIGLMYVSDYYYGALPIYWGSEYDSSFCQYNWMCMGLYEWTITRSTIGNIYSGYFPTLYVNAIASGGFYGAYEMFGIDSAVRPTFYLNSSVQYSSGSGTQNDPIRLVTE